MRIDTNLPHINKNLITYKINPKSYINAHNFPTLSDLVEEIKRIDNDSKALKAMLREPVFLDSNTLENEEKRLKEFLESIFEQEPKNALRRGDGVWIEHHTSRMKKSYNLEHLFKYHKIAKLIDNMLKQRTKPRELIKKLKNKLKL